MIPLIKTKKLPIDNFLNLFFDIFFFLQYGIYKNLNVYTNQRPGIRTTDFGNSKDYQ